MIYPLRDCAYAIHPDKPRRPCVQYQIGRCMAPCAGNVSRETYRQALDGALDFLNGKYKPVLDALKARMAEAAKEMNYESAAVYATASAPSRRCWKSRPPSRPTTPTATSSPCSTTMPTRSCGSCSCAPAG